MTHRRGDASLVQTEGRVGHAHGLVGLRVTKRSEIPDAIARARAEAGTVVIDFRVEQEDSVYPMVPTGADLHDMIRRPAVSGASPIAETGADKDGEELPR